MSPEETRPPLPPPHLAERVGRSEGRDIYDAYQAVGRGARAQILELLPRDWAFEGKSVLDFGCGAGRVLRHFLDEAQTAHFCGCDIDGPSIEWVQHTLSPPLEVVRNDETPPLPWAAHSFDLIWALSVFTHIDAAWSEWLLELHRLLDDGGLLIATFLGAGMSDVVAGEPWREDRIGMNVLNAGRSWDQGGPSVQHSPWWIREHWGRIFDIEVLHPSGFAASRPERGHGYVLLRKKEVDLTPAALKAIRPEEEREIEALRHNIRQLQRETAVLEHAKSLTEARLEAHTRSLSWRLARPLRAIRRSLRGFRQRATA